MGEKAVLTVQAHVFQIDPETKKKWLPTSTSSVRVAYYHDPSRKTYRIIAIEGGKPLINSTVTANMTFTKTSPKFGQWSDHRANTVYGLGFSSEKDLSSFSDKFTEAKSAARTLLEERKRTKTKDQLPTNENKDDAIGESASPPSTSPPSSESTTELNSGPPPSSDTSSTNGNVNEMKKETDTNTQASQQVESLRQENSKLKVALASSAQNVKKWESEMQTLRNNNAMLTTALEESTQHVAEWKRQLQKYKEECDTLRKKVNEAEGNSKSAAETETIKQENEELKEVLSAVQIDLEQKTKECKEKDRLISELNDKMEFVNSEKEMASAKVQKFENQIRSQEESYRQKNLVLHQKHKEIETQLTSLLSLQKELMKQSSS